MRRYQYHPPKYDRGPLHPVQSPPSSDPQARDFVPGPFNVPRLKHTFQDTVASDLMTLAYLHTPPGTAAAPERVRLRPWDDSSPYHKNRPLRGPRGSPNLPLLEQSIHWRNIPEVRAVSINCFVPQATENPEWLIIARNVVQAISGATPEVTKVKKGVAQWGTRNGDKTGAKATIHGDAAYEFLDKVVNMVFPRIKDWPGISGALISYGRGIYCDC
jgi:large subunit ribosomal protein L5